MLKSGKKKVRRSAAKPPAENHVPLQGAALFEASLAAALEGISAAAFIVGPKGVTHANSSGRALVERDAAVRVALKEIAAGRKSELPFEVTRLAANGAPPHRLALLRDDPTDPAPRTAMLGQRWSLTPRQEDVLGLLARGLPNKTIALSLRCAERTVEQHVRVLFDKVGVDSRAVLIALFWTARL